MKLGKDLREYDIVKTLNSRIWKMVLNVSKNNIIKGIDVNIPGLYLFYGMWYGSNPKNIDSFGKIEYINPNTMYDYIGKESEYPYIIIQKYSN